MKPKMPTPKSMKPLRVRLASNSMSPEFEQAMQHYDMMQKPAPERAQYQRDLAVPAMKSFKTKQTYTS